MPHSVMRTRVMQAAYNNAVWCDTVCRIHGSTGQFLPNIWLNRSTTPPFYPNAVTLTDAHDQQAQLAVIHELLAAHIPGAWAVKDSFCALDLTSIGFQVLFEAMWIYCPAALPLPSEARSAGAWEPVRDAAELEAWELAWNSPPADVPAAPRQRLFLPPLLADRNVLVLAAEREQRIVAGAIANRSDMVVGLSNVFVPVESAATFWAGCVTAVRKHFPDLPLVGYETGEVLDHAEALGFEVLQPLRVWQTVMQLS